MTNVNSSAQPKLAYEELNKAGDSALQKLIEGNQRYLRGKSIHPNQSAEYRIEVAEAPKPFAVILSCSDSRVPPEIIFDCGIGDLFVIRVAGNILNNEIIGSIEYAVEYFGSKLIVVMGHKRCGAVMAAVQGGSFPGQIHSLVDAILPAVKKAQNKLGDLVENTIIENISLTIEKLKSSSSVIERHLQTGNINITGAYYDVDDGRVVFHN
jgi:carbonic anhydrase